MSAIIGSLIPKIEGFQPIPNAVMIPFMEAQSAALAFGFGLNYEFGKRKIRSMSNDEFNSLTSEQITNMSNEHTHIILSQFQAQVPKVMPMQTEIFKQYVIIEKLKVQQNIELMKWMANFVATGANESIEEFFAHLVGTHAKHGNTFETPPDKFINPKTGEQGAAVGDTSPDKSITLTENLGLTESIPQKISPADRTKLMAHYTANILALNLAMTRSEIKRKKGGLSNADQTALYLNQATIRKELKQQKSWLANVTAWRKPY